ncbi:MAG TPA: ABC transporter substrate-binding protein [Mycobacteriales bacterium]|nr:ABC transporter substrate-binding protein [Mycobacteriales bacterium]
MKLVRTLTAGFALAALALTAACGSGDDSAASPTSAAAGTPAKAPELRLGYFANVTHASAVYGVAQGTFQQSLGSTKLTTSVFNAGPAAIEAMAGGAIDASFIGPNPSITGFANSGGKLLRIVAGTTYGGASLVVKPTITDVSQLAGKKVATPQLGNTQDVAAKEYFKQNGVNGVNILNQDNAISLDLLKRGEIDGAWVPEPWASRLVIDGGGKELIDESSLWPAGKFVTTQLIVSQKFLSQYPGSVEDLLKGLIAATDAVSTKSPEAQKVVNDQITKDTGKGLSAAVLTASFAKLTPTLDPVASSLAKSAKDAADVGVSKSNPDLKGIYDLKPLNALLKAAGKPAVSDENLGV